MFVNRKQIEVEIKTKQDISSASSRIITYIYEKIDRGQSQIIDSKFRDHLLTIGYDKEDSKEVSIKNNILVQVSSK